MNSESISTGKHLIIDFCYIAPNQNAKNILLNLEHGERFLSKCISVSDMVLASNLSVTNYPNVDSEQSSGYSITGHLQESHITIHTWPEDGFFTFDMFTCKSFDEERITALIKEFFGLDVVRSKASIVVIDRNIEMDKISVKKIKQLY